jgi:uncharacterized protein (DUF433 family)
MAGQRSSEPDIRFEVPLYRMAEAARYLGVPTATFATWAKGYVRRPPGRPEVVGEPIVTALPSDGRNHPTIPFIGLAEGMALAAFRSKGVAMQRIRPALMVLAETVGLEHALASKALYTDGAEVLYDYAERQGDTPEAMDTRELVVVRKGQRVFTEVVQDYLERIEYGPDGYARLIHLPDYHRAEVVADPERSFGQPIFAHGAARVADVLERFWAGEDLGILSDEFGVPLAELEDVLRVASRRAA